MAAAFVILMVVGVNFLAAALLFECWPRRPAAGRPCGSGGAQAPGSTGGGPGGPGPMRAGQAAGKIAE